MHACTSSTRAPRKFSVPRKFHGRIPLVLAVSLACAACAPMGGSRTAATPGAAPGVELAGWRSDAPGIQRHIRVADLPPPSVSADPEASIASPAQVIEPAPGALPMVPEGFAVEVFATGLEQPRRLRVAPNGDVFVAESGAGRVLVLRQGAGGAPGTYAVFAQGLDRPYGIAFVPPVDPRYVYVAAADRVVRYPYRIDAMTAAGPAEVVLANIPTKRHWTRDLVASRDGSRLFVAVGSASNLGVGGMPDMSAEDIRRLEATHGLGAAWGEEENRATVRVLDADGRNVRNYANGLRNCSGMAMRPGTDELWCVVNERDHLGPYHVPDFMAQVRDGAFYGWPWYTIGNAEDPALAGRRPDLKGSVQVPEVLIQAHSSALGVAFYDGDAFPAQYRGDAFVALHGSHSRPDRTGYKVIRVRMNDGRPSGGYEDFMTGFVVDNDRVWGRPAGLAVARDGALLVSDDANGTIFRVTPR